MSWAQTKKINSDMSKPLDILIKGQRTLGASDDTIAIISNTRQGTGYSYKKTFIPKVSGVVRILFSGSGSMYVYENGVEIGRFSVSDGNFDISVSAGKVYSFKNYTGTGIDYVKIGAQIVDGSLFEVADL